MTKFQFKHPNNKPHNWLVYKTIHYHLNLLSYAIKGHVFDLGCGEMPYKNWILRHADKYTGVDWGDTIHTLTADIIANLNTELPMKSEVADTIISISVIEHLCEPQTFLNEAFRILKKNSSMILQVPFMWWVHEEPHDYYRYTQYGLKYMFEKAGFSNIKIYHQSGFWCMWTLKFNYQSRRLIQGPWIIRSIISLLLHSLWAINQRIAPLIDQHWEAEGETIGYFVVADKL